jgi:hypothetical protein
MIPYIVLVPLLLGALYTAYYFRKKFDYDEGVVDDLFSAIKQHHDSKNGPWGNPEIKIDVVDRQLWEDAGIEIAEE